MSIGEPGEDARCTLERGERCTQEEAGCCEEGGGGGGHSLGAPKRERAHMGGWGGGGNLSDQKTLDELRGDFGVILWAKISLVK